MTVDVNRYYVFRNALISLYMNNYTDTIARIHKIMDRVVIESNYDINYICEDNSGCGKEIKIRIIINDFDANKMLNYKSLVDEFIYDIKCFILSKLLINDDPFSKDLYTYVYDNGSNICDIIYLGNTIEIKL